MIADALGELRLELACFGQQPLEPGQPAASQLRLEVGLAPQQAGAAAAMPLGSGRAMEADVINGRG